MIVDVMCLTRQSLNLAGHNKLQHLRKKNLMLDLRLLLQFLVAESPRLRQSSVFRLLCFFAIFVFVGLLNVAQAQIVFFEPNVGSVRAVANNGNLALIDSVADEALRYTDSGGIERLGFLNDTISDPESRADHISDDGTAIAGSSDVRDNFQSGPSDDSDAFIWTQESGLLSVGTLDGFVGSTSTGISGDGTVVIGQAFTIDNRQSEGFRWTADTGAVSLGPEIGIPRDLSSDGRVIIGGPAIWKEGEGTTLLPVVSDSDSAVARAVSGDGSIVVGAITSPVENSGLTEYRPVYWRNGDDPNEFVTPDGFSVGDRISATDTTADGLLTIGLWETNDSVEALIWVNGGSPISIQSLLESQGNDLSEFGDDFLIVDDISSNGDFITGRVFDRNTFFTVGSFRASLNVSAVPEPSSLVILGIGTMAFACRRRRLPVRT